MRAQLVEDQWADPELLPALQRLSSKAALTEANLSKGGPSPATANAGDQRVAAARCLDELVEQSSGELAWRPVLPRT